MFKLHCGTGLRGVPGRPGAEPSALEVPPSRRRGRAPAFPPYRVTAAPPAERGAGGRAGGGREGTTGTRAGGAVSGSPVRARHAGCKVQEETPGS